MPGQKAHLRSPGHLSCLRLDMGPSGRCYALQVDTACQHPAKIGRYGDMLESSTSFLGDVILRNGRDCIDDAVTTDIGQPKPAPLQLGKTSCRERVLQHVELGDGALSLK